MAKILFFAEQRNGELRKTAAELATIAQRLAAKTGGTASAVLIGPDTHSCAEGLGQFGVKQATLITDSNLANYSTTAYALAVHKLIDKINPDLVLFTASATGRDLSPAVAGLAGNQVYSDCTQIDFVGSTLKVQRPVFAGKTLMNIAIDNKIAFVSLRPNSYPIKENACAISVDEFDPGLDEGAFTARVTEFKTSEATRPELTEADIIVSGGRGMGGPENFAGIEALADTLGAAVGASRAAVDAGWRPHSDQVGQTGKTVSPKLYIACGISGAIQHLAGMSSSKIIVAVNKDAEAPIFKAATYGIVGDLFAITPVLDAELKKIL
ncbi:MAG: electron transfer flavoprotein subunit alpha/FixB family protein [Candidatus Marinimicrobia bacterium]|nr:electron transfer flavoprotein subunit alpha/FixB family protein [Candidatus Neomarinimicrobiota bacterium]